MTTPKSKGGHFETLKEMNRRHAQEFKQEASATTTECPDDCHFGDHDAPAAPERSEQWGEAIAASTEALGLIQANNVAAVARLIQQHSTLIAQRERLLEALDLAANRIDFLTNWIENSYGGTNTDVELGRKYASAAREAITTSEQEGREGR